MNIADRIQNLRKSKGISQEELADKIGVSRQAVSKWESEQSMPDIEKIILMSDFFEVTTDYLLKGIESVSRENVKKIDARIFALGGTVVNFIGLVTAIVLWIEEQEPSSVAVGLILMAVGCLIFGIGQYVGTNKKQAFHVWGMVNIWFLSLIPISCIFNAVQGIIGRFWWNISPIPELGNSLSAYALCWISYAAICVIFDVVCWKRQKRQA